MSRNAVLTALEEQVGCYRRLAKLAELQHEHVQQSQTEGLLQVLARRQEVLEQISTLEQSVLPAKRRWSQYLLEIDSDSRTRAETLLAESRLLLEQITAADRNDALVLKQRQLNLGRAITQATSARQINRTYASAAYGKKSGSMDLSQ